MVYSLWRIASRLVRYSAYLAGFVVAFIVSAATLWIVVFILHLVVPDSVLREMDGKVASDVRNYFQSADAFFGIPSPLSPNEMFANPEASRVVSPIMSYYDRCFEDGGYVTQYATMAHFRALLGSPSTPTRVLAQRLVDQTLQLQDTILNYRDKLNSLSSVAMGFSTVLIVLGMLTTIVSALNSSQLGSGESRSAIFIKITAIVLPALATALTAFNALYASPELTARLSQTTFNLNGLRQDINATLLSLPCETEQKQALATLNAKFADWDRKMGEIVINAEYAQVSSQAKPPTDMKPKDEDDSVVGASSQVK